MNENINTDIEEITEYIKMLDKSGQQVLMNFIKGYALALINQKQIVSS